MQASTPPTSKDAREIALRQGLLCGTIAGCLGLLSTACRVFLPGSISPLNFIYILAFIAFFVAGWRATKKTGRIDIGTLAGFWAGVAVAILGLVTLLLALAEEYRYQSIRLLSILTSILGIFPTVLMALLFGAAIGALGGFIGKTYTENPAPQPVTPATPAQPAASTQPSAQTIQPAQPLAPAQPAQPAASTQSSAQTIQPAQPLAPAQPVQPAPPEPPAEDQP